VWLESLGGAWHDSSGQSGATLVVRKRLLDLVRSDLITQWSDSPPSSTFMVQTLQHIERAREACVPDVEQRFAAELVDIGGLDLVVEVAHDMRSPLTSILFLAEILHREQSGALNDVQKRQIGIVYSAALGLVGMASDMIEVARGGNRLQAKSPVTFSVNEMLGSINALVSPFAEQKGVALSVRELQSEIRLGYPVPLSRILVTLATNAMKFTHEGSVEISAVSLGGMRVEFSVHDSGPGIPPEAMDTLYQPFRRETTRKSGYTFSGTGLGLAICQRLIKALGSELVLETSPEWGTRFSFVLQLPPANIF
jgi:signal transduction histidine kinase